MTDTVWDWVREGREVSDCIFRAKWRATKLRVVGSDVGRTWPSSFGSEALH